MMMSMLSFARSEPSAGPGTVTVKRCPSPTRQRRWARCWGWGCEARCVRCGGACCSPRALTAHSAQAPPALHSHSTQSCQYHTLRQDRTRVPARSGY
eukprot:482627-Rhodomonas_salina.2